MPNHITNLLTCLGEPEEVARFVAAARGCMPRTGDPPGPGANAALGQQDRPEEPFCFHALVPLPAAYSRNRYDDANNADSGYELEVRTWGVKWGAYDQKEPIVEGRTATYQFRTAWGSPTEFLAKVARKWPTLLFFLSWGGEGPARGRARFQDRTSNIEHDVPDDIVYPDHPGDDCSEEQEEAWSEQCTQAEYLRMREHPRRVADTITSELAGRTFDADADFALRDWLLEQGYPLLADALANGMLQEDDS